MRTKLVFLVVCAACNMASNCQTMPPDSQLHAELSPEELAQGPSSHQMKGAIISDIRIWRELDKKIAVEGRKEMPSTIVYQGGFPVCDVDKTDLEIFTLKSDLADQPYRVEETAYYCKKENLYYYHYQGGPRRLSLWMGPYHIDRKRPKTDDQ